MEGLKKSFLVRGNNIVGFSDKNFSTAPIGTVLAYAGNEAPRGYLLANGASYKVADYPNLYAVIGNTYGGDSTNFNVPNLVDKFIQGSTTSGTEKEAGLPNITGNIYGALAYPNIDNAVGVFGETNEQSYGTYSSGGGGISTINLSLDASKSNEIYGNSDTVQPPALTMVYIIKAFHTNEGVDSGVSDDVINYIDGEIAKVDTELKGSIEEINDSLVDKADADKVVNFEYIRDTSSADAKELIQKHWSEHENFKFYNLHLDTSKWAWSAEIYFHTPEYGTVLLRSYGNDASNIWYGKVYAGVWTWQELATMDNAIETIVNPTELDTNKFLKSGYYSLGDASNRTNLPMQNVGTLLVYYAGHYVIQEYILNANLRRFMRRSTDKGANWSAWKELATMDKVADVPNTVIVSKNTKVKLNSNCYYTVINGVCYVTLWGFTCTEAGQYVVNSSMPKTRLTMKGVCTYGSNGYEGGCAYVFYDNNGNNKLYIESKCTEPLYGSFSYPVAE